MTKPQALGTGWGRVLPQALVGLPRQLLWPHAVGGLHRLGLGRHTRGHLARGPRCPQEPAEPPGGGGCGALVHRSALHWALSSSYCATTDCICLTFNRVEEHSSAA